MFVLVVIFAVTGVSIGAEPAWQLSFTVEADHVILREPIWTLVAVTNLSGEVVPQAGLYGDLYLDGAERPCRRESLPQDDTPAGGRGIPTRPMAPPGTTVEAWLELGDECGLASAGESALGSHRVCYRDALSTDLRSISACVSFVIETPRGIDEEAYEAFGHDPLADSERYGELLRRFPTSTYAAYIAWEFGAKGLASMPVRRTTDYLKISVARLGNSVPDWVSTWRSYSGEAFICWREDWFGQVLNAHPAIWFGDELRFTRALDDYLLGNKAVCTAQLHDLALHGRPYVAAKAAELLAAMRVKGMLEEAVK